MNKLFVAFCAVSWALVSHAAYLYWQVDASDYPGAEFDHAVVKYFASPNTIDSVNASAASGRITSYNPATEEATFDTSGSKGYTYTVDLSTIANAETYSYYIELQNSAGGFVARSTESMTYAQLKQNASIVDADLALGVAPIATVWHGSPYTPVPEPTSAMLMLFGAAFLGLKRKNRRIA